MIRVESQSHKENGLRIPEDGEGMSLRNLRGLAVQGTLKLLWEYQTSRMSLLDSFVANSIISQYSVKLGII
jgi:hypothetical protein